MNLRSEPKVQLAETVTVLIAAYNAAPFLHRAVNSALEQTSPPLEILIIDDASTDNTLAVAHQLSRDNPCVRVISLQENGGPAKARNAGLDAATGDWIAILDADDAILPERLERLIKLGHAVGADIIADNFYWFDLDGNGVGEPGISLDPEIEDVNVYRYVAQASPFKKEADWGLLKPIFKRQFLQDNNLHYPEYSRHGEDFLLMFSSFLAGAKVTLLRTPGYLYTSRQSGWSRTSVNYEDIALHLEDLLNQDRIQKDEALSALLQERVQAVIRLSAEYRLQRLIQDRNYPKIIVSMFRGFPFAVAVVRFSYRAFKRLKYDISQTLNGGGLRKVIKSKLIVGAFHLSRLATRLPLPLTFKARVLEPFIQKYLAWRSIPFLVRTKFGAKIVCDPSEFIQYRIYYFGTWEPNLSHFLQSRLKPGDVFVDVGANIGYFTLLASKCVGPAGRCISIEASPKIFRELQRNLEINGYKNTKAINIAVSDREEMLKLYSGSSDNTGRTSIIESRGLNFEVFVPANRLDAILSPEEIKRARIIKIDIEGAEAPVLVTLLENLEKFNREVEIAVEINPPEVLQHGIAAEEIIARFKNAGFNAYVIDNDYCIKSYMKPFTYSPPLRLKEISGKMVDIIFSRTDAGEL